MRLHREAADEVQLNTLYIVTEGAYLHRDGQTLIVEINKNPALRLPIHLIDSIACFGRVMVTCRTAKPDSALWKVTRSMRPLSGSRVSVISSRW